MNRLINRRTVLRGAGVALTLPWLASLAPRSAGAAAVTYPKRFLPIYFPNGSAEWWRPTTAGVGDAWSLSPILQPFQALKKKMIVLTGMENYSAFGPTNPDIEPSHGRAPGAFLACVDATLVRQQTKIDDSNGISVDQVIAQSDQYKSLTNAASMQVGLSTWESYCDGKPCSVSRSISWKSPTEPMYKQVDPGTVFTALMSGITPSGPATMPDPEAEKRKVLGKSVLDAVYDNAKNTQARLGTADKAKLDQFLTSVREVENKAMGVSQGITSANCSPVTKPTLVAAPKGIQTNSAAYSKEAHADVMNDLIVMAFQCDVTRIISYMLEDERSEFEYSHVPKRQFSATGSVNPTNMSDTCGNYHGAQHAGANNNEFSSINWWQSVKIADLCSKLDAISDGEGVTALDNTIVMYASCMHGGNHYTNDLPVALVGGGGGILKTNQHVKYPDTPGDRPMRDLYFTILNKFYNLGVQSFGVNTKGTPNQYLQEILNA